MMSLEQDIRNFCSSNNLRLNTDLGQHYLIDEDILESIVESAKIEEADTIVEIGPGIGVLTKELIERAASVIAIEVDQRICPLLQKRIGTDFELRNENALHTTLPETPYKIVANIPYHITSPLLRHAFLESTTTPSSMTLLIQKEVAEKICSTNDASMLTIIVQLFGDPTFICSVPTSAFLPPPKVDSAVLHIDCFAEPKADRDTIETIFALTKLAFSQRRKKLSNTIGTLPNGMQLMEKAEIDPTVRPQTLSIDQWIALAKCSMGA